MSPDGGLREWTGSEAEGKALEALAQAQCYWDAFDAAELERVRRRKGTLDADAVTRILGLYRAARSVKKVHRQRLADELNRRAAECEGKPLVKRAVIAGEIAAAFKDVGETGDGVGDNETKTPHSAISKLLWFLSPSGWTMYDSLGRKALGISSSRESRFLDYYERLYSVGFTPLAETARAVLRRHDLPENLAERSIDFLLMTAGGRKNPSDGRDWVDAYLATRRKDVADALKAAAAELASPYSDILQRVKTR